MISRRRLPLLVAFPALYVGIAAFREGDTQPSTWLAIAVAIVVALVFGRVPEGTERGPARAQLWTATALSIAIATSALSQRPHWAAFARAVSAAFATLAALRAVFLIHGDVGLAPSATEAMAADLGPRTIDRGAVFVAVLGWGMAALDDGLAAFNGGIDASAPTASAIAGGVALLCLGAMPLLLGGARHHELDVAPRVLACAGVACFGIAAAIVLAATDTTTADAALALGATGAAAVIVPVARAGNPLKLARLTRRLLTLTLFGGPLLALAAIVATAHWGGAGVAFAIAAFALLVGASVKDLEEPFLPMKGTLLAALEEARSAAREREARTAIARASMRIREACAIGLGPTAAPSPELWLLHPTRVLTVDAAGYLQERSAELPPSIFDVALGEPYATLRTSVLRALEVRRADLRPLLAWLEQRGAICATVIAESADADGLLVIPAGARTVDLTLEEVRAIKLVADAFVAITQATSSKARHLARELELQKQLDIHDDAIANLRHTIEVEGGRHALAAARLARPATVGIYSAAARLAYDELERRIGQDAPTVIVAPGGIDVIPYVARAHLSGPRKTGPFVVVDGTASREHDVDRWSNERASPLALADRGLLLLDGGASLPRDVQIIIARAIATRQPPWERATPLDVAISLGVTRPLPELLEAGLLAPELAARFEGGPPIELPRLRDRPEDLHSIVADRLAREGLRVHGRPIGIDAAAFSRLVEYPFVGEEAELMSIVTLLVGGTTGEVITAADVDALHLAMPPEEEPKLWPEGARRDRSV